MMRNGSHGGLAGKARQAHYRSRASRRYAQQQIADYLEPSRGYSERYRNRPIPIRRRSEFAASAVHAPVQGRGEQLELPLSAAAPSSDAPVRISSAKLPSGAGDRVTKGNVKTMDKANELAPARSPQVPTRALVPVRAFSGWRFLCGCALGGAAAAVILLMIQLALG